MIIDILTLFPGMFEGFLGESLLGRAQKKGLVKIKVHNLRKWAKDKHKTVDDRPFGGGPGMVLKAEPIALAVEQLKSRIRNKEEGIRGKTRVILLTPQGRLFNQKRAKGFAADYGHLILICGHYEGIDERVREDLVDEEVSVGDYILTGGELAAAVITEAVVRLIPGVVGKEESLAEESLAEGLLEYPQYTQPADWQGKKVPEVLLSGNHEEIAKWRRRMAEKRTKERRSDLWGKFEARNSKS